MNLSFRTLKGDKFKLDASPNDTVLDLKKKVVERYEDTDYSGYRLIYKGKVLNNEHTLSEAELSEQGFIVVMRPKRPAVLKADKPPAAAAAAAATPESEPTKKVETPTAAPAENPSPAAHTQERSAAAPATSGSSLVTGAEYEASVQRIVEMGFAEAEVKRALRAAFNNPDRAVDYLFNGIPASAEPSAPAAAASTPATPGANPPSAATEGRGTETGAAPGQPFNMFEPGAGGGGGSGGGGGGGARTGNLDFLRHLPPFNNMRRVIQSNPSVVQQLLQQLEQTDPALLQLIHNNREEFFRLLNEPVDGSAGVDDAAMDQLAQDLAASGAGGDNGPAPGQILVTEEENQVITRLTELGSTMGLEQVHVVQAWLACDRDENLAANFLINQADDLRAQQAEDASLAEQQRRNSGGGNPPGGNPPNPPSGN